jgi:hypothetical protein
MQLPSRVRPGSGRGLLGNNVDQSFQCQSIFPDVDKVLYPALLRVRYQGAALCEEFQEKALNFAEVGHIGRQRCGNRPALQRHRPRRPYRPETRSRHTGSVSEWFNDLSGSAVGLSLN